MKWTTTTTFRFIILIKFMSLNLIKNSIMFIIFLSKLCHFCLSSYTIYIYTLYSFSSKIVETLFHCILIEVYMKEIIIKKLTVKIYFILLKATYMTGLLNYQFKKGNIY